MKRQFLAAENYCSSVRDGTHDTPAPTVSGFKLVTGKHIKNGIIDPSDAYYISEDDFNSINKRSLVEKWDVLMSMIGTIGEVAVVTETPLYAIKNVALFKCGGSETKGKWLAYYLRSNEAKCHMQGNMKGASQQFLSLKQLRALPIPIFPEYRMKKIVDILSAYDDLIENNRKQIKLLEEAAQRLYKEWFIDLRFPGYETTPIIDGIPEGWDRKKLGEWVNTFSGGTPSRKNKEFYQNGSNFWLKTQELTDCFIFETEEKITDRAIEHSSAKYIYPNSIIMAMYGATIGKLGIAATRLTCNQACCVFDLSSDFEKMPYLYLWLKSNRDFFVSQGIGSAQSNLSQAMIKNFDIIVPCQTTLSNFSPIATKIFAKILKLQKSVKEAKNAQDRLLPKLMTGELEVK